MLQEHEWKPDVCYISETRNQKPETRNQKLEIINQKLEIRNYLHDIYVSIIRVVKSNPFAAG
jgi:hypothetical protein